MLTPIEINNKEFKRAMRGYSEYEVDVFLDQVARDYEALYRRVRDLEEALQQKEQQLANYKNLEETMNSALVLAQKTSQEIKSSAQREAELLLREARGQAEEIIRSATSQRELLEQETANLRHSFNSFRAQLKAFLRAQLELLDSAAIDSEAAEAEAAAASEENRQEDGNGTD